ncbi:uncharacterized protein LOC104902507 isoform X2 [Beta vulgaris subsp. vulgaris]|uniref:uncharacterized protein LOC104902507 isoform X2 n=1 Tax=Beta vulgaris subsp. vulgaris TaxID=3555 RepID=UPI002036DADF|nr:uncharacterized protein LOC104902507 isoform X2 [Beta vulgaris subsp. vulgaris]
MLENPSDPSSNTLPAQIKRYAPPNQRNRGLNRRKSGDRSDRTTNLHSTDGDTGLQSALSLDHSDTGSTKSVYETFRPRLIALNGCCTTEASQLLHQQRPVMYTGSAASAWGNFRLPHQLISGPQMDFLAELQNAINNSSASSMN